MNPKGQHNQLETTPHEVEVSSSNLPSPSPWGQKLTYQKNEDENEKKKGKKINLYACHQEGTNAILTN
jgi:hypothetical protein